MIRKPKLQWNNNFNSYHTENNVTQNYTKMQLCKITCFTEVHRQQQRGIQISWWRMNRTCAIIYPLFSCVLSKTSINGETSGRQYENTRTLFYLNWSSNDCSMIGVEILFYCSFVFQQHLYWIKFFLRDLLKNIRHEPIKCNVKVMNIFA
jgi:hypothetical protein